jgi:hypothetical protein
MNMRRAITWVLVGVATAVSCGERSGSDPFRDAGSDARAGSGGEGGANGEAGENQGGAAPVLGRACLDDAQCRDEHACTQDFCDARYGRCRHDPDAVVCDDGVFCNGPETCDRMLGCRAGPVVSCTDSNTCTIDTCVEADRSCRYEPRDADGDGDPAVSCYGKDCDDRDPLISSKSDERCRNVRDDDCDGQSDEGDCVEPEHDGCGTALAIEQSGSYTLSTGGAARDFSLGCAAEEAFRDLVVAIVVPDGEPRDVDIVARRGTLTGRRIPERLGDLLAPPSDSTVPPVVALAATDRCGSAGAETACARSLPGPDHESTARLVLRRLEPGAHTVYVAANQEAEVTLEIDFRDPTEPPTNRTCGTALPLSPGTPVRAILAGLLEPPLSACSMDTDGLFYSTGGLFYSLELDGPRDVRVRAVALDAHGVPVVSLRSADCVELEDELTCRSKSPAELFAHALPAGAYVISVAGTGPAEVELLLSLSDASDPPATQGCGAPPILAEGVTKIIDLGPHADAVRIGCLTGAPDATFEIETPERSDVMLVQVGSDGDTGSVLVAEAPCDLPVDVLSCETSDEWPLRTVAHDVPEGGVRAVVQSLGGMPASLTAFRRPAANSRAVLGADECGFAVEIPETGGRFEGNTANLYADYAASCDYGGQTGPGAADQMLHLVLAERRRVVFDMRGSSYDTLLTLRTDDGCPGTELEGTCSVGFGDARSFLDVILDEGSYNVQIDGYNGANGRWVLEVFTAVP